MAEKNGNEAHEQETDYSSDDSDIIDAVDLHEEILKEDGEDELIIVSRQVAGQHAFSNGTTNNLATFSTEYTGL